MFDYIWISALTPPCWVWLPLEEGGKKLLLFRYPTLVLCIFFKYLCTFRFTLNSSLPWYYNIILVWHPAIRSPFSQIVKSRFLHSISGKTFWGTNLSALISASRCYFYLDPYQALSDEERTLGCREVRGSLTINMSSGFHYLSFKYNLLHYYFNIINLEMESTWNSYTILEELSSSWRLHYSPSSFPKTTCSVHGIGKTDGNLG